MRLAFISFYSGYADRGGETYVDALAENLSKNHEVTLFQAGPSRGKKIYRVREIPISINPDHPHANLSVTHFFRRLFIDYFHLKELLFTLKLFSALWKFKPNVIFPQNAGWEVLIIRIFSSLRNCKVIISGQSGPGWNDRVNLLFHPDIFVALTNAQAVWAKKATIWRDQKIAVIPNGVDTSVFQSKGERRVTRFKKPVVLIVGAAVKSKRIQDTIRAVALLKTVSLLVAGVGPMEKEEDLLGKKLLGEKYQRIKVRHQEMPSVYRSADVFTLCSDSSEAFGIVYLEALASGLPCVATDDASRREILGEAGIYVKNPEDKIKYSQKIALALNQKPRNKYQKQAQKYSWDKVATEYEMILKNT